MYNWKHLWLKNLRPENPNKQKKKEKKPRPINLSPLNLNPNNSKNQELTTQKKTQDPENGLTQKPIDLRFNKNQVPNT